MVKPTSADVLKALLALDAYNQGYGNYGDTPLY
jgi:hypothetical protein